MPTFRALFVLLVTTAAGLCGTTADGASQLLTDFPIFSAAAGESPKVADSSYNSGRAADATNLVVGGGRAAVFTPNPYGGLQWYIKWPLNKVDGTQYAGLAFKLAADSEFVPEVTAGIQVQPNIPKGAPLKNYLAGGKVRPTWQSVFIPLADLRAGPALVNTFSFFWQDSSGRLQPTLYLTDIVLLALPPACGAGGSKINTAPPQAPPSPPPPRPPPRPPTARRSPRSLSTLGNGIFWPNGTRFAGRGVNVFDTRSCWACLGVQSVPEAKRRIDFAVGTMGASFLRLNLEAHLLNDPKDPGNGAQYCTPDCTVSDAYIADIKALVQYAGSKYPHIQVLVSLWQTTYSWGETELGWPAATSIDHLRRLVRALGEFPWVWFGVSNEPESNFAGAQDAQVWSAMNAAAAAVREEEASLGLYPHIVTVQGTRNWGRSLSYYVSNPITAGGGNNIVYETHPYNPAGEFAALFVNPSKTLPVFLGELGPVDNLMTSADAEAAMRRASNLSLPWTAWSLHMRCPPNMLQDLSGGGCGVGMPLRLTDWGRLVQKYINL